MGRRNDSYSITKQRGRLKIQGTGYGYGAFFGVGSVTMNPFVSQDKIDYEFDGFVLQGGMAGIYDAKKFSIGLALGTDFLMDKNKGDWIYQGKPWLGMVFGLQLN
ncbi:hypothetical protein [Pedobacter jamesrossensis]|uniref:Outer membrane protein beta-barrel domain-containing protein n=1 Tax=Pedobacter jamesrossensis TaxID=1908238 RepID=A0ABV8NQ84_9SPHI